MLLDWAWDLHFRNHSAETLYGWKDYEIIGQRFAELLVNEQYYAPLQKILKNLTAGVPWSGKFPFKKKSGEVFKAMVTKSPLYEDGELLGIITVSSDAAIFIGDSENMRTHGAPGLQRLNFKRIQWHPPRPLIAPVPQIASSVSNLVIISFVTTVFVVFFSSLFFSIYISAHLLTLISWHSLSKIY